FLEPHAVAHEHAVAVQAVALARLVGRGEGVALVGGFGPAAGFMVGLGRLRRRHGPLQDDKARDLMQGKMRTKELSQVDAKPRMYMRCSDLLRSDHSPAFGCRSSSRALSIA